MFDETFDTIQTYIHTWFEQQNPTLTKNVKMLQELLTTTTEFRKLQEHKVIFNPTNEDRDYIKHTEDAYLLFAYHKFVDEHSKPDEQKIRDWVEEEEKMPEAEVDNAIMQYNRCLHPPLSLQALNTLKSKEKMACTGTNITVPLYVEEELKHLPQNVQNDVKEFFQKKPQPDGSLQLSRYFCNTCTRAYKAVCGQSLNTVILDYKDEAQDRLDEHQMQKSTKIAAVQELYNQACVDMRMLYASSCEAVDKRHLSQIKQNYKNAKYE
jgi:hypothetical protein